ncbi:hypothetical protein [Catenulispora yoronensis]|uniref:hypothetical protein n=1 Tax=Catenulispora yoronensis TaxID=450799 RepID=UPI0031CE3EEF
MSTTAAIGSANAAANPSADAKPARHAYPVLTDCQGGSGYCFTPADPDLAAGPSELIETVNCAIATYSKTGTQLAVTDLRTLVGIPITAGCFDPRVIYIPWSGRFAISFGDNVSAGYPMHFAVSTTNNPGLTPAAWHSYATPATADGFDQPKIQATKNTLIVSGNSDTYEQYYVYQLNPVLNGNASPAMTALTSPYDEALPSVNTTAPTRGYFVSITGAGAELTEITGQPNLGNVALTNYALGTGGIAQPPQAPIPGGFLDTIDSRPTSAAYEVETGDGKPVLEFSGNTACGADACAYDVKLDLTTPTAPVVLKNTTVGRAGYGYAFGSVTLDAAGNAYLPYSRTDAANTPSAAVAATNAAGTVLFDSVITADAAGSSACGSGDTAPCTERWGDYFGGSQDPTDPTKVWVIAADQAGNGGFSWATSIAEVSTAGIVAS